MSATPSTGLPVCVTETTRLRLRELAGCDAAFIVELLNDPDFITHVGDRGIRTAEDAQRYIASGPAASYVRHGFGLYVVELKTAAVAAGLCGLLRRDTPNRAARLVRTIVVVQGALGVVGVALIVWWLRKNLPESPRWLESQGRSEEAEAIMVAIEKSAATTLPAVVPRAPAPMVDFTALAYPPLLLRMIVGSWVLITVKTLIFGFVTWLPQFFLQQGLYRRLQCCGSRQVSACQACLA